MTRLYLDVDGVINANFNASRWSKDGRRVGTASTEGRTFQILWNDDMIRALNKLIQGGLEVVWLTTWCDDADKSIAPLVGLPQGMRVLHPIDGNVTFPSIFWKHEAMSVDILDCHESIIWADDEIITLSAWGNPFSTDEDGIDLGGVTPLQINPNHGLTPDHMKVIAILMDGDKARRVK